MDPFPEQEQEQVKEIESTHYVVIPVAVAAVLLVASALLLIRFIKKRRMDHYKHFLIPLYSFNDSDEEWDEELESYSLRMNLKYLEYDLNATSLLV